MAPHSHAPHPPRSRFEEILRVEFSDLRGRLAAAHAAEVGRVDRKVLLLEEENARLRSELGLPAQQTEGVSRPALKRALTKARLEHNRVEQGVQKSQESLPGRSINFAQRSLSEDSRAVPDLRRPWGHTQSARMLHVTPPSGPAAPIHLEEDPAECSAVSSSYVSKEMEMDESAGFNGVLPGPTFQIRKSRSPSGSRRGSAIPMEDQMETPKGSNGIRRSRCESDRERDPNRLFTGGSSNRQTVHGVNFRSMPSQRRSPSGSRPSTPAQQSLAPSTPPPETDSPSQNGLTDSEAPDSPSDRRQVSSTMELSVPEDSRVRRSSLGSMSVDGDVDFEVLPEWRNARSWISSKRRSMDYLLSAAADIEELSHYGHDGWEKNHWLWRHMLPPSSATNGIWLCLGVVCLLWDLVLIPLDLFDVEEGDFVKVMSWMVRLYWTVDIGKSFLTGRLQVDGFVEMRPWKVAKQYARTWLPLDVVCLICDWSIPIAGYSRSPAMQGLRFVRGLRLLRLVKVRQVEVLVSQYTCSEGLVLFAGLLKMIVILLSAAHVIACIWYRIGADGNGTGSTGWVAHHGLEDAPLQDRYAWSLHWSLAQFTGEVLFEPRNSLERGFAIFVLVVAFLLSALFVSGITTSMTRLLIVAGSQSSQLQALRRYLFSLSISSSLTARLQRNAQHVLAEQKRTPPPVIQLISEPLQVELYYELHSPAIIAHPFFAGYDSLHPAAFHRVCHMAVNTIMLSRGDIVFSDYEAPANPRMYFVYGSGGLAYKQSGKSTQHVEHGDWVCEPVLWTTWIHCGSLSVTYECELIALDAGAFRSVLNLFPTRHACKYAASFVEQLNKVDRALLSDLWVPDFAEMGPALPKVEDLNSEETSSGHFPLTGSGSPGGLSGTLRNLVRSARPEARRSPKRAWN